MAKFDPNRKISKVIYKDAETPEKVVGLVGGVNPPVVHFMDFDGTILQSYTEDEIMGMDSLPEAPDHSGDDIPLTFDRWNWTLAQIKEQLNAVGAPVCVGANYHTTDGKTHVIVDQKEGGTDSWGVVIGVYPTGRGTIDWGDGNTETPSSSTIYHTYSHAGVYDIKLDGATSITARPSSSSSFFQCNKVIGVRCSASITSIGSFSNCYSLQNISIPEGVTSINSATFNACSSLQGITIPSSVTSIASEAFRGCGSLRNISIPEGIPTIGGYTFDECYSLQSITIPSRVTSIGTYAFRRCRSLKNISIPEGVTSINSATFSECSLLQSITIPSSVTSIGGSAFKSCSSLQSITIPEGVTSIGGGIFTECYSLQSITIPSSVTSIGDEAFKSCSSLQSITIPEGVTSIGDDAFKSCYALQSITIPSSVTSIGSSAFSGCSSLQSITIPSSVTSIGSSAFSGCSSLQSITIPEGVTSISYGVFQSCSSLQGITIPEGVTSIGARAFYDCRMLYTVRLKPTAPPELISSEVFNTSYQKKIVVPVYSLDAYKSATNWSKFAGIIEDDYTADTVTSASHEVISDITGFSRTVTIKSTYVTSGYGVDGNRLNDITVVRTLDYPISSNDSDEEESRTVTISYLGYENSFTFTIPPKTPLAFAIESIDGEYPCVESSLNSPVGRYAEFESTNQKKASSYSSMKLTSKVSGDVSLYIRSNGESNYDYSVISKTGLDPSLYSGVSLRSNTGYQKASTKGMSKTGNTESDFTKVDYTGLNVGDVIIFSYGKDGGGDEGTDTGYILIPTM